MRTPGPVQSSVTEFRCLFTHDVSRKQKRWHDGIARFHAFNKRIMLTNLDRHPVSNTHWTSAVDPAEGDEIRFVEQGVIAELGEIVGTAITDLTPILSRRNSHPGQAIRQTSPTPSSPAASSRLAGSVFHRHVRLSDLLGPVGRRRVSVPSRTALSPRTIEPRQPIHSPSLQCPHRPAGSPISSKLSHQDKPRPGRTKAVQASSNPDDQMDNSRRAEKMQSISGNPLGVASHVPTNTTGGAKATVKRPAGDTGPPPTAHTGSTGVPAPAKRAKIELRAGPTSRPTLLSVAQPAKVAPVVHPPDRPDISELVGFDDSDDDELFLLT